MFCVVSRYHGGAFVVFSGALNDNMEVLAVEGSFASVLGGAPGAFARFWGLMDNFIPMFPVVEPHAKESGK